MKQYCGLTSLEIDYGKIIVEHCGNMGNSIQSVNKNLDLMKFPSIDQMKKDFAGHWTENGDPSYQYTFIVDVS